MTLVGRVAVSVVGVVRVTVVRHGDMPALRTVVMAVVLVHRVLRSRALVGVVAVRPMNVTVVRIVDVVAVRDSDVAAPLAVDVLVTRVGAVVNGSGHGKTPHVCHRESRRAVNV
jgi:hypothetical protein